MTYQLTVLPNGLRVASERLEGVDTITVAVSINVGARYENESEGGLSHMLEHMAFKGTKRRSARQIAEEFDDIGGVFNAYTSLEQTVYYAKVLMRDLPVAVDILGDILQNSMFDEEELVRERGVILQEIAMHYDAPDDLVFDYFHEAVFPHQPLGRSILGKAERVATFSRDDLQRYIGAHYHPKRMVITAAGNVDHERLVLLVKEHFDLSLDDKSCEPAPGQYGGGDKRVARKLEQLHVAIGFKGVPVHDADYYPAQLLATVLGGGMSSRLFQEVREKRGLAYTAQAFLSAYNDVGVFGMYAATAEEKAGELLSVLCEQMQGLTHDITPAELIRAKNQHIAGLLMSRESTSTVAEWIGRHLLVYGKYMTSKDIISRLEAITVEDLQRVAARILDGGKVTVTALGPLGALESYETIETRLAA